MCDGPAVKVTARHFMKVTRQQQNRIMLKNRLKRSDLNDWKSEMEPYHEDTSRVLEILSPRKKTVLVIDDSQDVLEYSAIILKMENYNVVTATSGEDAFAVLDRISQPDLILLDMCMEPMSGPEFLKTLETKRHEIFESVPVVFLSGLVTVPETKALGFIRKPFDIDTFLAAVHRFIEIGTGKFHDSCRT